MSKNLLRIVMAVCVGMGTFVSVASVGYADTYDDGIGGPGDALDAAGAGAGAWAWAWAGAGAWAWASTAAKSPLMDTKFKFDPNSISPSSKSQTDPYAAGTGNIKPFLQRVARILLIIVSTGAVLSIVIGGFYMATSGGDSEKANKGKIIITYNIIAIFVALLAYGIIQFVTWIIWA